MVSCHMVSHFHSLDRVKEVSPFYKKPYYKSHKNSYQYCKSHENLYQVLQVTCVASEGAMKLKVFMIKSLLPQYQVIPKKNITRLLPLALLLVLHTRNQTDSNKLEIFSGIALYYGDNYIISVCHQLARFEPTCQACQHVDFQYVLTN